MNLKVLCVPWNQTPRSGQTRNVQIPRHTIEQPTAKITVHRKLSTEEEKGNFLLLGIKI